MMMLDCLKTRRANMNADRWRANDNAVVFWRLGPLI
jgi:hypothetical protein